VAGRFLVVLTLFATGSAAVAQWTAVPPLTNNPSKSQFAAHELYFSDSAYEVPYYLRHFAQVANSVVETTFTSNGITYPRGFLNIKVNRSVADNMPYNARIQEMQLALAYFYCADRPWNVYRGNAAVKVRLEAMLARWVEMQHPTTGLFTEYSATNWSLAPTGFGVMAAAQALDLIQDSGLPFDATVFNNAKTALRKALMALFTRSDMQDAASSYSNQFSGAYHAAMIYLENWPDAELDAAFVAAVQNASASDQSVTGYFYEADGPDFGYSDVHERNLRIALPRMRSRTNDLMPVINLDEARWSDWLAANLVLQPGLTTPTLLANAGINTRTSTTWQGGESRPLSEFTPLSRAFSYTATQFTNAVRAKTDSLPSTPTYGALTTNSPYSYVPFFVFEALGRTETWHPSDAERAAAINSLPYLASNRFNRVLHNNASNRNLTLSTVRRPSYYGIFNAGHSRQSQMKFGLGLIWNPTFGTAMQSVAGSATNSLATSWGTARSGMTRVYEQRTNGSLFAATIRVAGNTVNPSAGTNNLADGTADSAYTQTRIALPASMRGKPVKLRFRLGSDDGVTPAGAVWRIDTIHLVYKPANYIQPAAITSAAPAGLVTVGSPFSHTFTATGQPAPAFALTAGSLPPGLALSPSGALSGTVAQSFTNRTITVAATNGVSPVSPSASQTFVLSAAVPLSVTTTSLSNATTGAAYNALLAASGGAAPYAWSVTAGSLPAGLTLSGGTIAGTPLGAGTFNFTVTVTDNLGGTAARNLALTVGNPASLSVVTPSLPSGIVGASYAQTLAAVSGTGPYTWSIVGGSLPPGLVLSSSGVLTGTPTSAGASTFTAQVADAASGTATRAFTVNITGLLDITTPDLADARTGAAYSQTLSVAGGVAPHAWSVVSGSLPPGLTLSSATGTVAGTPAALGSFAFTVKVSDANGAEATKAFVINSGNTLAWDAQPLTGGIQSGNGTWTPGGTTNWSFGGTNVAWVDGSEAVISGGMLTLGGPVTASALTFNTAATTITGSNTLTLKSGAVVTPNVDSTIAAPLAGPSFTKSGAARLILSNAAFAGNIDIASGELRLVETAGQRAWNGAISGAGSLLTLGGGTVALGGSNTFSGQTTLTGPSVLRLAHGSALGATNGNTRLNGDSNNAPSVELTGNITVPEPFQLIMWTPSAINTNTNHAQIRNVSGTNELTGLVGLDAGGGRWDIASTEGHLKVSGSMLNIAVRNATNADTWRTLHLSGPSSGEFTGPISDATNGFSKVNVTVLSGTWTLGGSNKAYSGATTISNGLLDVQTSLASEIRAFGGVLAGNGATASNLIVSNGATVLRRLTNWTSPGAALTAAQVRGTNSPAWTVRLDATGLTNFSETPLSLPVLSASNGVTGLAPAAITVQATNFPGQGTWSAQTNASGVSIVYAPVPLTISTPSLPEASAGQLYSHTLTASGGVVPHSWSLVSGSLPGGLQLSSDGVLSGTPVSGGYFTFEIGVTDSASVTATRTYVLHVVDPLGVATDTLPSATVGVNYSQYLQATGGVAPFTWSLAGGNLPPGFSLGADGLVAGVASAPGTYQFTAAVTDGETSSVQRQVTLGVVAASGSFDGWAAEFDWDKQEDRAAGADPDGDGMSNLMEWAFALDPLAPGTSPVVADAPMSGGQREVRISFRRSASATRAVYRVEARDSLTGGEWTLVALGQAGEPVEVLLPEAAVTEVPLPDGAAAIVVSETVPPENRGRFLRLTVIEQSP
jgi:autotransporter-associated beta strand protein